MVSNIIHQLKEPGCLEEMVYFRTEEGNVQDKPEASCSARKNILKKNKTLHNNESMSKGHSSQINKLPMAKTGII